MRAAPHMGGNPVSTRRPLLAEEFLVGRVVDRVLVTIHGDVEAGVDPLQPVGIALAHRGTVKLRLARHVALNRIGVDIRVTLDQPFHRRGVDESDIGAAGRDCLEDIGLAVELQNLRLRQQPVNEVVGIDVR